MQTPTPTESKQRSPLARQRAERLKRLRKALGLTQESVVRESAVAAEALGGSALGYEPLDRKYYSAVETGRLHLTTDARRAVLCRVVGVTRDEFADVLDGKVDVADVLAKRAKRLRRARLASADACPASANMANAG